MNKIKHVWFDLDGTLTVQTPEFHRVHDNLRYDTFAEATGRARSEALQQEYENLYKKYGSNSAVFRSLGLPSDYWSLRAQTLDPDTFYEPVPDVYTTVAKLANIVPISLFTNSKPASVSEKLKVINIDEGLFTYKISGDDVQERKPALEGFKLMVQKSDLPADRLLFVGDRVDVDIKPAKAVGMLTCLVYSDSPEATFCFNNFADLLSLFE